MKVQLNPEYDYSLRVEDGHTYLVRLKKQKVSNPLYQALAALHELVELVVQTNEGWIPDFKDYSSKYVIISRMGKPTINVVCHVSSPIVFNSLEQANDFFKIHTALINKALPLL